MYNYSCTGDKTTYKLSRHTVVFTITARHLVVEQKVYIFYGVYCWITWQRLRH